ncbi:MAG TPA: hypothetical protein VFT45_22725 [Longimicrobium sp.]|nr:hypothetical protein [Longimicrobium sp.]
MPISSTSADPASDDDLFRPAPACRRSSLSPQVRFAIFFGVLFALKLTLPYTPLSAALQVLVLAATATVLVWRFWWACGESKRGGILLLAILWIAALAKIAMQEKHFLSPVHLPCTASSGSPFSPR